MHGPGLFKGFGKKKKKEAEILIDVSARAIKKERAVTMGLV